MALSSSFLFAYLLGGLTFLPLLVVALFLHAYLTLPHGHLGTSKKANDGLDDLGDESLKEKLRQTSHEPEAAAGYFAVCREYVPGGVNGKPPERTTPAGETIAAESPSVYQSIYRSVFERGKTQVPSFEAGKSVKRARNVFYVVLRHGHLVLFDNADQLEVRHVIALANYDVDIYAGGEDIPEGELYIKRNCLRLSQKMAENASDSTPKPFYLFGDNCSEKEDMYFSILHNQARHGGAARNPPTTQPIETDDMIGLIRHLHLSEHNQQFRWINALIGRVFLGLYKTPQLEQLIRAKMNKKMARVPKPAFISSLQLGDLDMGHSAPSFSNIRLKECNVDGDVTIEMDVKYSGYMRLVVAAVARIELGSRLKPREVDMVLATTLKALDGHMLLRIKPPPSNRVWFSFETMPKMDLSIEPILSSRQITYSVVTRAIESRLKEVLAETLVLPFWDDMPFHDTEGEEFRGGIWKKEQKPDLVTAAEQSHQTLAKSHTSPESMDVAGSNVSGSEESFSSPARAASMPPEVRQPTHSNDGASEASAVDAPNSGKKRLEGPKVLRASSFTTAATPVVSSNAARVSSPQNQLRRRQQHDATSAIKSLSAHSPEASPVGSLDNSALDGFFSGKARSNSLESPTSPTRGHRRSSSGPVSAKSLGSKTMGGKSSGYSDHYGLDGLNESPEERDGLPPSVLANDSTSESASESVKVGEKRAAAFNQTLSSATAAAKSWGLGMLQRQMEAKGNAERASPLAAKTLRNTGEPMGRGQPLPPVGQPLPKPKPDTWSSMAINSLRRKPVGSADGLGGGGHSRKESLASLSDMNGGHSRNDSTVSDSTDLFSDNTQPHARKESLVSLGSESLLSEAGTFGEELPADVVSLGAAAQNRDVSQKQASASSGASALSSIAASRRSSRAASQTSLSASANSTGGSRMDSVVEASHIVTGGQAVDEAVNVAATGQGVDEAGHVVVRGQEVDDKPEDGHVPSVGQAIDDKAESEQAYPSPSPPPPTLARGNSGSSAG